LIRLLSHSIVRSGSRSAAGAPTAAMRVRQWVPCLPMFSGYSVTPPGSSAWNGEPPIALRRLFVRYSPFLLSRRRAAGLPAKEPFQEPTQAGLRRQPAMPGDCRGWSSAQ
jgi:hypothetical protein